MNLTTFESVYYSLAFRLKGNCSLDIDINYPVHKFTTGSVKANMDGSQQKTKNAYLKSSSMHSINKALNPGTGSESELNNIGRGSESVQLFQGIFPLCSVNKNQK